MKKLVLPLGMIALVGACKKEASPARSELIQGSWRRAFEAQDTNRNLTLDASERKLTSDPALLNAVYNFNADGSGTIIGNGKTNFTWKLINNDQQFVFNVPNVGGDTSYIHTLTSSELILEYRRSLGYYWNGLRK